MPSQYLADFLRGVVEGDGCIKKSFYERRKGYTNPRVEVVGGSQAFMSGLRDVVEREWGARGHLVHATLHGSKYWRTEWWGIEALRFLANLYVNAPPSRYWSVKRQQALEVLNTPFKDDARELIRRAILDAFTRSMLLTHESRLVFC
ncbi:MAG: hypothetical protein H5U04_12345 [Firmicutes bacterium]|nr:hypothetical protein [Bacillota bacterium]